MSTEPLLHRCAAAAQPPRQEGSEQLPVAGERTANSATSPATTAAASTTVPTAATQAGAADSVRRRRVGFEEISPADPPGTSNGPPQGPDGEAGPELINVFTWKVLTLPIHREEDSADIAVHEADKHDEAGCAAAERRLKCLANALEPTYYARLRSTCATHKVSYT